MPAALAFVPVVMGAAGTVGGLAAFAATTAGMFTIAGAALSVIGSVTGEKGLSTIGTLMSLGSSVAGMAGAGAEAGMTAADTVNGAINTDGLQSAQAALNGGDAAAEAISKAGTEMGNSNAVQGLTEAAKTGESIASSAMTSPASALNERALSMPDPTWSVGETGAAGGAGQSTGLIGGVMDWAKQNPILSSGLIKTGGEFIAKGFGRNPQAEQVDLNRERLALEQRLAEIQLSNRNSAAGVKVNLNANTAANLYPNGAYKAPGGGFIQRAMT